MVVEITCTCGAKFELKRNTRNKNDIACPSCGRVLPNDASKDLRSAFDAFDLFRTKLQHSDNNCYDIRIVTGN